MIPLFFPLPVLSVVALCVAGLLSPWLLFSSLGADTGVTRVSSIPCMRCVFLSSFQEECFTVYFHIRKFISNPKSIVVLNTFKFFNVLKYISLSFSHRSICLRFPWILTVIYNTCTVYSFPVNALSCVTLSGHIYCSFASLTQCVTILFSLFFLSYISGTKLCTILYFQVF